MNPRYLETFRRHRTLFLVPPIVAMLLATWFNVGEPAMYRSSTSVWSDAPGGSAHEVTGAPPPAAQEQSMLNELLTTEYFRTNVARRGPLAKYLQRRPSEGWGPTALLSKLRGPGTLDERIAVALSPKRVTSLVQGPHVLKIDYDAPTPALAAGTLRALVTEFRRQRGVLGRDALTAYRKQLTAASEALTEARRNVANYRRDHPGSTSSDPQFRELAEAERNAVEQLAAATESLGEASAELDPAAFQTTLRVVDPAEVPTAPTAGPKRVVLGLGAGFFAGALVSILGIVALTKTWWPARADEAGARGDAPAANGGTGAPDESPALADAMAKRRTRSRSTRPERGAR